MSLSGKNILVVGASSGIGKSVAELSLQKSANVFVAGRNDPKLSGANYISLDVNQMSTEFDELPEVLHGVVYAPGSINLKPFHRIKLEDFQADMNINLFGAIKVLQACMGRLKKAEGASVILYSTVAVNIGMNFHSSIAAAKGAVEGLAKSLAAEWAGMNIRVNVLAPSLTDTPLAERLLASDEKKEASNKRHPIGRFGQPADLGHLTTLLLSDEGSWITGQIIGVDGGMSTLRT
ncbi:oxidoreductase [Roseivirga seohaensis subsp. aquiponti]|uniref:Oxidoreductase n=1 Tax=Roseivirga seohaensis subsp. aquiponti TaxID=1566026 RepID=A0A0L8AMK0_9BACT|nr:SDR family oxidoreductase [Roseivirga seohaensis]KOF03415.1 oxidoreductase [Roseivirga seohaensis subsp. aquiponti]